MTNGVAEWCSGVASFFRYAVYLHVEGVDFFSVHISVWLVFWATDPNVGAINQPNDTRECPFVFKNTFYFLLLIYCKIDISM